MGFSIAGRARFTAYGQHQQNQCVSDIQLAMMFIKPKICIDFQGKLEGSVDDFIILIVFSSR